MKPKYPLSRRNFIAASAAGIFVPTIIPSSVLGLGKRPAPSNRINVACIGFGTIAHSTVTGFLRDDRAQIVAMADPNRKSGSYGYAGEKEGGRLVGMQIVNEFYAETEGRTHYRGCRAYEDFRDLLDNEDVDAVNISTPDHWHAVMAVYCANRKKHVYGQKPLAVTVDEGRKMVQAVNRNKITWQTGSQQRSESYFREAVEFVQNERIGKLKTIQIGLPGGHSDWNQMSDRQAAEPVPDGLNYDLWEGPAPHRDYRPALLPLNWRHNFDYSGGMITDWGAHHMDIAQWAMGMDESGPIRIDNIKAELPASSAIYNTAPKFHFECTYASGVKMVVTDTSENPQGILFEGEGDKSIFVKRGEIKMNPYELRRERIQDSEIRVYKSTNHIADFLDGIETGKRTAAPIEASHRSISICHLANIAIRLGRDSLEWDPKRERVKNDDAANKMLSRPIRGGWKLR